MKIKGKLGNFQQINFLFKLGSRFIPYCYKLKLKRKSIVNQLLLY